MFEPRKEKMRDHQAMKGSGRLITPCELTKYGTMRCRDKWSSNTTSASDISTAGSVLEVDEVEKGGDDLTSPSVLAGALSSPDPTPAVLNILP